MEIQGNEYLVTYTPEENKVTFQGTLRLRDMVDYDPIEQLLTDALTAGQSSITLNLRELQYMNSSGITMLSMFIYKLSQNHQEIKPIIQVSSKFGWQTRLLKNLKQMVPTLQFEE